MTFGRVLWCCSMASSGIVCQKLLGGLMTTASSCSWSGGWGVRGAHFELLESQSGHLSACVVYSHLRWFTCCLWPSLVGVSAWITVNFLTGTFFLPLPEADSPQMPFLMAEVSFLLFQITPWVSGVVLAQSRALDWVRAHRANIKLPDKNAGERSFFVGLDFYSIVPASCICFSQGPCPLISKRSHEENLLYFQLFNVVGMLFTLKMNSSSVGRRGNRNICSWNKMTRNHFS